MTRKLPLSRSFLLSGAAIFCCAASFSAAAQESPLTQAARAGAARSTQTPGATRNAMVKPIAKRASNRKLVKIRARAGDTLSQLGDRFGVTAEEIAGLNGLVSGAPLQPGREILIPLPSPESLARTAVEKLANHNEAAAEADGEWESVQGVWFRKGGTRRESARSVDGVAEGPASVDERKAAGVATRAKIVDVSEAERSTVAEPVWIFLVGGARVEADRVIETNEGVWYSRGNLSIFIERSRVERIERERAPEVSGGEGSWTERGWSTGNPKFDALIRENGARFGVDPYLIFCVMEQESQFKPWVVSPKGARGLMQLMPGTAAHFGVRRPHDPAENIMGGTKYLKQLLENFNGRVDLVLAGYNAGEGAVMKYGGKVPPYRETRNYVQRISKRYGQNKSIAAPAAETSATVSGLK